MTFEEMKQIDVRTVDKNDVRDIRDITYGNSEDPAEIVQHLQKEIGNLYLHRRGDVLIYNEYTPGKTINDVFGILIAAT